MCALIFEPYKLSSNRATIPDLPISRGSCSWWSSREGGAPIFPLAGGEPPSVHWIHEGRLSCRPEAAGWFQRSISRGRPEGDRQARSSRQEGSSDAPSAGDSSAAARPRCLPVSWLVNAGTVYVSAARGLFGERAVVVQHPIVGCGFRRRSRVLAVLHAVVCSSRWAVRPARFLSTVYALCIRSDAVSARARHAELRSHAAHWELSTLLPSVLCHR